MSQLTQSRWLLLACVLVLTVGGLILVLGGDEDGRIIGIACLLFFGVGGGATIVGQLVGPPAEAPRRSLVSLTSGRTVPAVVLSYQRMPRALLLLTGLGLMTGGAVFALVPRVATGSFDSAAARVIVGVAAGYFAVAIFLRLRGSRGVIDTIELTAFGVRTRMSGATVYVPWDTVESVELTNYRSNPMLMISVSSPNYVVRSGGAGLLNGIGQIFYGHNEIPIALRNLSIPPDRVATLVRRFVDSPRSIGAGGDDRELPYVDDLIPASRSPNSAGAHERRD